jgi:hypothetical protein
LRRHPDLAIHRFISSVFASPKFEFVDLSGEEARRRPPGGLPEGINPAELRKLSCKEASERDVGSSWYRVELSQAAAAKWQEAFHLAAERRNTRLGPGEEIEGVHRIVRGPLPMDCQTGTTPTWWSPPGIDFRATEVMQWYRKSSDGTQSGVGQAMYTGFDEPTHTLWIYHYSCQHHIRWTRGNVPAGQQFSH